MIKRFKKTGKAFIFPYYGGNIIKETIEGHDCFVQKMPDETSLVIGNMEEFTRSRRSALRVNYDVIDVIYSGEISGFELPDQNLCIYYVDKDDFYIHKVKGIELEEEVVEEELAPFEKALDAIEDQAEEVQKLYEAGELEIEDCVVAKQETLDAIAEVFEEEPKEDPSESESRSADKSD